MKPCSADLHMSTEADPQGQKPASRTQISAGVEPKSMKQRPEFSVCGQRRIVAELDALLPAILDRAFKGEL